VGNSGIVGLRQLRSVRRSLTTEASRALVQAFISCRLDYCNSLLAGVADVYLRQLQSVQNAAARLVSGAHRHDHITSVLIGLHWLPVRQRIIYKTAVLVWKCLHGAAPRYLADLCVPAHSMHGRQQLRSTASGTLLVPRVRTATGQRSFAINGPRIWNSLPADLRTPDTTRPLLLQASSQGPPVSAVVYAADGRWAQHRSSGAVVTVRRVRRRLQIFRLTYLLTYLLNDILEICLERIQRYCSPTSVPTVM